MENSELPWLVRSAESGNVADRQQLFTRLYAELHRIAQSELRRNSAATVSPTTLLHETFLSLSQNESAAFADRGQFLSYAARAMRGLLIDYLRTRHAQKRGGLFEITSLPTELSYVAEEIELQRLAAALDSLAQVDARLAECVDLKYFCGFSNAEIADFWHVSVRTVAREWDKALVGMALLEVGQAQRASGAVDESVQTLQLARENLESTLGPEHALTQQVSGLLRAR